MKTLRSIYKNPIAITVFYGLIALFAFWITNNFDVFFAIIGAGISVLLLITAILQNQIQKDNIKLQMFDKRYPVYEAIADSLNIAMQKDYSDFILSGKIDPFTINKLINDANSKLDKQALLSQVLFEEDIYVKISRVC